MQLSKNFELSEFYMSATAIRRGIDNTPPANDVEALKLLVANVLQPLRDKFGPIVVTSGYRSKALNKAIGGATTSQHSCGEAADIKIPGVKHAEVCKWIRNNLQFDQLIYEFGEMGWIHVSYKRDRLRKEVLTARKANGKTVYLKGLWT